MSWAQVKRNIISHSIKSETAQDPVYQVGDYVRIRTFKPDKDTPTFTYKKGPLPVWEIRRSDGQSSGSSRVPRGLCSYFRMAHTLRPNLCPRANTRAGTRRQHAVTLT